MKTYTIYLIRHGRTEDALQGRYIGQTDAPLSEAGAQALDALRETMVYPPVAAVFSSPLRRCTATAARLYPGRTAIEIDGLKECSFGEFEGKSAEELKKSPVFPRWLAGEPGVAPPFGESSEAFGRRVCSTFEKIVEGLMKTGTAETAIVTHGGVMMALLAAYGLPELPMPEWRAEPGCGFALKIHPSLWMRGKKLEVFSLFPFEKEELPD